jgi:hypothetical protein
LYVQPVARPTTGRCNAGGSLTRRQIPVRRTPGMRLAGGTVIGAENEVCGGPSFRHLFRVLPIRAIFGSRRAGVLHRPAE